MSKEIAIKVIADFCKWLQLLESKKGFVYRGQSDIARQISCSAYRRLADHSSEKIEPQLIDSFLVVYLELLIGKAKMRGFIPSGLNDACDDLELMAHLQHQGAATGLIDFTTQPLVALWFACDKSSENDGVIYALPRSEVEEVREKDDLTKGIKAFYDKDKPSLWQPSAIGNRIIAQGSVFLFGVSIINSPQIKKFVIEGKNKEAIKMELETVYGINEESLFSDFSGYAVANAQNKDFDVKRTIDYWERQIELASKNDTKKVEAHFNCGVAYSAIREHDEAIKQYGKVIEINPKSTNAYYNRGVARSSLGEYKEAIKDYDRAIGLDPKDAIAYNSRGNAKSDLEKYKEAIKDYDRAIDLDLKHADAYINRGVAKSCLGEYKEAIKDYDKAMELNPKHASAYNNRGNAKYNLGEYKEAIKDYDKAIELDPKYVNAYNNRGAAKSDLGKYKEAIKDCDKAIELDLKYSRAYYNRGNAKYNFGEYKEAIKDYDKAIEHDPKYVNTYNNRGAAKSDVL